MKFCIAILFLLFIHATPARANDCGDEQARAAIDRVLANPGFFKAYAERCISEMAARSPGFFDDIDLDRLALIWAAHASHLYRPYGPSMAMTLENLIQEQQLDYDNYVLLTIHLFRILRPNSSIDVDMVGWEGGMVGNHAQIIVNAPGEPLMIDPTVNVVARVDFDEMASGKRVSRRDIIALSQRDDPPGFQQRVVTALQVGDYRPSHILYYFNNPEDYAPALASVSKWPTPAIQERPN